MRMRKAVLVWLLRCGVVVCVVAPAQAALVIDPALSALTPSAGAPQSLSGSLSVALGAEPPLASNTTLDVTGLTAVASGGLSIGLAPALEHPAAGVLSPSGAFLIPNLFLRLFDGVSALDLTVPNVLGRYGAFPGCLVSVCLETSFDVDTGGPLGVVSVAVFAAVPEPAPPALVALGLLVLAAARRGALRGTR
jgi:hypothetical protein